MTWLYVWLLRFRRNGWFVPGFLRWSFFPFSWQAWALTGALMPLIAFCGVAGGGAMIVAMAGVALYGAFAWWTVDPDDPAALDRMGRRP